MCCALGFCVVTSKCRQVAPAGAVCDSSGVCVFTEAFCCLSINSCASMAQVDTPCKRMSPVAILIQSTHLKQVNQFVWHASGLRVRIVWTHQMNETSCLSFLVWQGTIEQRLGLLPASANRKMCLPNQAAEKLSGFPASCTCD